MSEREPRLLIEDIIASAEKIKIYISGLSYDDFINDNKTVDAVIRNFEIIGEAAKRLPEDFKTANPEVDWFVIIGFRNRIVHDYMGIDYEIVWTIIQKDIDLLKSRLDDILEKL